MSLFDFTNDYLRGQTIIKSKNKYDLNKLKGYNLPKMYTFKPYFTAIKNNESLNDVLSIYSYYLANKKSSIKENFDDLKSYTLRFGIDYEKYFKDIKQIFNNFDINYIINNNDFIIKEINDIIKPDINKLENDAITSYCTEKDDEIKDIIKQRYGSIINYINITTIKYNNNEIPYFNKENVLKNINIAKEKCIKEYVEKLTKKAKYLKNFIDFDTFKYFIDKFIINKQYDVAITEIKKGGFTTEEGKDILRSLGYDNIEFVTITKDILNGFNKIDNDIKDNNNCIEFIERVCGENNIIKFINMIYLIKNGDYYIEGFKIKDNKNLLNNYFSCVETEISNENISI